MFIRPWVRVILARLKNPDGWERNEYRVLLTEPEPDKRKALIRSSQRTVLSFWTANGFPHFKIDCVNDESDPEGFRLNPLEYVRVYWAVRRLDSLGKHNVKRRQQIKADDARTQLIVKLTNLGD